MKRLLIAAVLAALAAADARADWGTPPAAGTGERYGVNPILKKMLWWKKDAGCSTCGSAGFTPPPGAGYPGTPGSQMPGTLVFPNHQFNRSPRDFFMWTK